MSWTIPLQFWNKFVIRMGKIISTYDAQKQDLWKSSTLTTFQVNSSQSTGDVSLSL